MMAMFSTGCMLVLLLPLSQARGLVIEPGHKFAEVVQAHFAEWDLNHDGRLEAQRRIGPPSFPRCRTWVALSVTNL
jgi:hypothetical protein